MNLIRRYEQRISDRIIVGALTEIGCEWVNWTDLAKERNRWRASGSIKCKEFTD
jgi:hypothetical protein